MKLISVAVCDDEETALIAVSKSLTNIFEKMDILAEIDTFLRPRELMEKAETKRYDLLFLDIDMPQADGIRLGKYIKDKYPTTEIVYVSNRYDLVFDTFKVHPFGFVRKKRFLKDLADVVSLWNNAYQTTERPEMISFYFNRNQISIPIKKVKYVESQGAYQFIYTEGVKEPYRLHESMETMEKKLELLWCIRVHKGYIVNFAFVRRIDSKAIILSDGKEIPVSRRLVNDVREKYIKFCRGKGFVRLKK